MLMYKPAFMTRRKDWMFVLSCFSSLYKPAFMTIRKRIGFLLHINLSSISPSKILYVNFLGLQDILFLWLLVSYSMEDMQKIVKCITSLRLRILLIFENQFHIETSTYSSITLLRNVSLVYFICGLVCFMEEKAKRIKQECHTKCL